MRMKLAEMLFIELLIDKKTLVQLSIILFVGVAKGTEQDAHNLPFVSFKMGCKE